MKRVLTDGVFDLLHANHIAMLESARQFGDWLIVAVISDENAQGYKRKPVLSQDERLFCVRSLSCVDEAFVLTDPVTPDTMAKLINEYRIDAVVHAGPATPEFYGPAEDAGIMHHLHYRDGINSTDIIKRIVDRHRRSEL